MTKPNCEKREIQTTGRDGCNARVNAEIYTECIIAAAEMDDITEQQMEAALVREFPRHNFHLSCYGGHYLRAFADRQPGDRV